MERSMIESPTKTLTELKEILGPPDAALLASMKTPTAVAAYQEQGRKISSSKVLVDTERIFGLAYATWSKASDDQKDLLVGFSEELLAAGVDQALALRAANSTVDDEAHGDKSARKAGDTSVRLATAPGLLLRDQAVAVLRTIAGPDEAMKERISISVGDAATPENLANGLERVAELGKEWVESPEPTISSLVKATRVGATYFDRLTAASAAIRTAVEGARPRLTTSKVSQGDIDVLDGLVLRIVSDMIHAFSAAQDIDGTIPTLVPIATRRLLASQNKRKPKEPVAPE